MNPAELHLLFNHIPTIGFSIGLALFALALLQKQPALRRASLVILFLASAVTIVTYVTGNDAQQLLKEKEGFSEPLILAHESAALGAFAIMEVAGFLAWLALWMGDRPSPAARWNDRLILLLSVAAFVLMARASYIGGAIAHPETEAAQTVPLAPPGTTLARSWGVFAAERSWVWPASETVHFIGLCLLLGVVMVHGLRLLGVGKNLLSGRALHQLIPLGMLGFALNLITGMMFFVATPEQYTGFFFLYKIVSIVAGAVLLLFLMLGKPATLNEGDAAPGWAKMLGGVSILVWLSVVFVGHMLPWLGNSF